MKQLVKSALSLLFFITVHAQEIIYIEQQQTSAMPLFIGVIGESKDFLYLVTTLKNDLEWSNQFTVTINNFACPSTKKEVLSLFDAGYPLVLFLSQEKDTLIWRLYDATQALMVKGKKYLKQQVPVHRLAHALAHDIWFELTGNKSPFLTKIAYIDNTLKKNKKETTICLCDYSGADKEILLAPTTISIAPHWNNNIHEPLLLYSEFTAHNVRLMALDMHGNKRVVLDVDGTSVGLSYDPKSSDVVYCRSGELWHFHYDPIQKKSIHRLVIKEKEASASPTLRANGDIIYCSQGIIKYYHADTKHSEKLTHEGYCVAPTFSEVNGLVAYSKRVKGTMQLFLYNLTSHQHEQITFDAVDKMDGSWSPCGQYIVFCYDNGKASRLATINIMTHVRYYITPASADCSYPAWSPLFEH